MSMGFKLNRINQLYTSGGVCAGISLSSKYHDEKVQNLDYFSDRLKI